MNNVLNAPFAPVQTVKLVWDKNELKKSLRFAFAHGLTCLQELMQNARRAGATRVVITYDQAEGVMTVDDDGSGITDFSVLTKTSGSGWPATVAAEEQPYGLGFLATLYACVSGTVDSLGNRLDFTAEGMLSDQSFDTTASEYIRGTRVTLRGIKIENAASKISEICKGFGVPVLFNGKDMQRPYALDIAAEVDQIEAGKVIRKGRSAGDLIIFLQGFEVWRSSQHLRDFDSVVHLDSAKYRGKWPDRDRVIDEAVVVAAVKKQFRDLRVSSLLKAKNELAPEVFAQKFYAEADSLNMLEVFNNVPVILNHWLGMFVEMPKHSTCEDGDVPDLDYFESDKNYLTQDEVRDGSVTVLAEIRNRLFVSPESLAEDAHVSLQAMAFMTATPFLTTRLDPDHWIYKDQPMPMVSLSITAVQGVDCPGTDGCNIILGRDVVVSCGILSHRPSSPFAAVIEGDVSIVVPISGEPGAIKYQTIDGDVLRQISSFWNGSGEVDSDLLNATVFNLQMKIAALAGTDRKTILEHVINHALYEHDQSFRGIASMSLRINPSSGRFEIVELNAQALSQ